GGHGDYRNIVLAPASVQELADLTVLAFDLADQYKIVVMIAGDGFLGQMSESLVLPQPTGKKFDKSSWALTGNAGRKSHIIMSIRLNPEDALEKVNIRLQKKYREIEKNEVRFEAYQAEGADYLLVGFGTASRIVRAAVNTLRRDGIKAGLFRPITLWPFPSQALAEAAAGKKKLLDVEMNSGQMLEDIRLAIGDKVACDHYGKMGGVVPDVEEIVERVKKYEG
ncbi:unnamed protein product, partial [marine sediment metagenome]